MEYAALLSSHSEDSSGILGPHDTVAAAASAGAAVVRAQPGILYAIISRKPGQPWLGWRGTSIADTIERMVS